MNGPRNGGPRRMIAAAGLVVLLSLIVAATVLPATLNARGVITWNVNIPGLAFDPQNLPIQVGDTVVWTNNDDLAHTVTSTDGSGELNSGSMINGGTYTHVFTATGTFTYRCDFHTSMTGSVIVSVVIPEFSNLPFVMLGILTLVLGLMVIKRKT